MTPALVTTLNRIFACLAAIRWQYCHITANHKVGLLLETLVHSLWLLNEKKTSIFINRNNMFSAMVAHY